MCRVLGCWEGGSRDCLINKFPFDQSYLKIECRVQRLDLVLHTSESSGSLVSWRRPAGHWASMAVVRGRGPAQVPVVTPV